MKDASKPIGIFDSGLGGLTVARAISAALPYESIYYLGDTKRCPYGTRPQEEVRTFVRQVGSWLERRDVKLVVIACNTATAAGLDVLQRQLSVPVVGVINPGARAAVQATHNRHVGVLATQGTCDSMAYVRAIHALDAGVKVTQAVGTSLVSIVETELASGRHLSEDWFRNPEIFDTPEVHTEVRSCIEPLVGSGVDTVVLGCTHYPLLFRVISEEFGPEITLVSSAEETCREVGDTLKRRGELVDLSGVVRGVDGEPTYRFATTSDDITAFAAAGKFIFGHNLDSIEHVVLGDLEALSSSEED